MKYGYDLVEKLDGLAQAKDSTIPRLALSWVLRQRGITSVLIGAKRTEQLEDNLVAIDVEWTDEEFAEFAELTAPPNIYPYWMLANFARS